MTYAKTILAGAALMAAFAAMPARAESCKVQASDKKLAGAAMNSFMKKCDTDAMTACTKEATDKKLSGAAKNSFTKKCHSDAVGA